jgi:hypothetical protein
MRCRRARPRSIASDSGALVAAICERQRGDRSGHGAAQPRLCLHADGAAEPLVPAKWPAARSRATSPSIATGPRSGERQKHRSSACSSWPARERTLRTTRRECGRSSGDREVRLSVDRRRSADQGGWLVQGCSRTRHLHRLAVVQRRQHDRSVDQRAGGDSDRVPERAVVLGQAGRPDAVRQLQPGALGGRCSREDRRRPEALDDQIDRKRRRGIKPVL